MIIKPVSELRNNFTEISKIVHEQNKPVFLTKNGSGDMVVMSIDNYNEQQAMIELYEGLARSEADSANGRFVSYENVKKNTEAFLKSR